MYEQICNWGNLMWAHQKAARGKRGRHAAAAFEYNLADHLFELHEELLDKSYRPGAYNSFYIPQVRTFRHEPKRRLISAAWRERTDLTWHHILAQQEKQR